MINTQEKEYERRKHCSSSRTLRSFPIHFVWSSLCQRRRGGGGTFSDRWADFDFRPGGGGQKLIKFEDPTAEKNRPWRTNLKLKRFRTKNHKRA